MDIELVKCECCGLKEECTQEYINEVKSKFKGKWLCGLCSEAVTDEVNRGGGGGGGRKQQQQQQQQQQQLDEAVRAHTLFCRKYKSNNPAIHVADGMMQMLRRRRRSSATPGDTPPPTPTPHSTTTSQLEDHSTFSFY